MKIERKIVLSSELFASSEGKILSQRYRAVLILTPEDYPIIRVEQEFKASGKWGATGGGWRLETLLEGGVSDSISIDYGQRWSIASGMAEAVAEAAIYVDHPETIHGGLADEILANERIGCKPAPTNDPIGSDYQSSEQRIRAAVHNFISVCGHTDGDEEEWFNYQDMSIDQAEALVRDTLTQNLLEDYDYKTAEEIEEAGIVYIDTVLTAETQITIA
jgi:hypothetical protein